MRKENNYCVSESSTIAEAIDNLVKDKKYDMVKAYLYFIIDNFQRMGLFDEIKILGEKIVTVLKILMHQYIAENNPDQAQITLDELFSIWETFSINERIWMMKFAVWQYFF